MCGAFLLLITTVVFAAGAVDEGIAAFNAGDYKTAIEKWQALIQEGRPEGLFFMGVMYAEGKGIAQNHAKAFELYTEAAQKDHAPAQYNLANQYATGEGVTQDFSKAEYWWTKAAERGLVPAQINLGNMYYFGVAGEKNPELARKWLTLAAEKGSAEARETLTKLEAEAASSATTAPTVRVPAEPSAADTTIRVPRATRPSADALRREAWVLIQSSGSYTIQVLASADESVVREYIHQQGLFDRAAYIETPAQGGVVFRVIYGSYASRDLADKALAALPRAVIANSPWIRTFAELHKLVDRRHAERGAR